MAIDKTIEIFEGYIPRDQWMKVHKVSIKFKDLQFLKWFSRGNVDFYRRYFLKITYNDYVIKKTRLTAYDKNFLKQKIKIFNHYLKTREEKI